VPHIWCFFTYGMYTVEFWLRDNMWVNRFQIGSKCWLSYSLSDFEAGTYLVTTTIFIPPGTIIVGEMYSTILGSGSAFQSQTSPTPVLKVSKVMFLLPGYLHNLLCLLNQVGNPGDVGDVEISDMVISTTGGSQGAIGIQWNIMGSAQGSAGLWDVHVRLGGATGTNINIANCPTTSTNLQTCASAFLGLHITPTGSGYFEVSMTPSVPSCR
jgi:hypothetical protein